MNQRNIDALLLKLLNNEASQNEIDELSIWLKKKENEAYFRQFIITHNLINEQAAFSHTTPYQKFLQKISQQARVKRLYATLKYAAILIALVATGQFLRTLQSNQKGAEQNLLMLQQHITLELDNGIIKNVDALIEDSPIEVSDKTKATKLKGRLVYSSDTAPLSDEFNVISVPNGKKFQLELADGTLVYLNSGSVLKFPINFNGENKRQVFLLNGEAFFDVAREETKPFIVVSENIDINVLGTEFNVSAYADDSFTATVLVEGAVTVRQKSGANTKAINLLPGDKATWNAASKSIAIEKVDPANYISWIKGNLIFKNTPFSEIIKKLERNYNIQITNNNKELNKQKYNASFDNETIQDVMDSFKRGYSIQYEIKDNHIIIN